MQFYDEGEELREISSNFPRRLEWFAPIAATLMCMHIAKVKKVKDDLYEAFDTMLF